MNLDPKNNNRKFEKKLSIQSLNAISNCLIIANDRSYPKQKEMTGLGTNQVLFWVRKLQFTLRIRIRRRFSVIHIYDIRSQNALPQMR